MEVVIQRSLLLALRRGLEAITQHKSVRAVDLLTLQELSESEVGPLIAGDWLTTIGHELQFIYVVGRGPPRCREPVELGTYGAPEVGCCESTGFSSCALASN